MMHPYNNYDYENPYNPPAWYNSDDEPCKCGKQPELLKESVSYSDQAFYLVKCPKCNKQWSVWVEG